MQCRLVVLVSAAGDIQEKLHSLTNEQVSIDGVRHTPISPYGTNVEHVSGRVGS